MTIKPVEWRGSSRDDLRMFPDEARERAGFELYQLQQGLAPSDWKPMTSIGPGIGEIRIQIGRQFRVLYVAKFPEAIYVLHAFVKKAQKTASRDRALARHRLNDLVRLRRGG